MAAVQQQSGGEGIGIPDDQGDRRASPRFPSSRIAAFAARVRVDVPLFIIDAFMILGAYGAILVLRFDGFVPDRYWARFMVFIPVAVPIHLLSNAAHRLYGQVWKHASAEEARRVALAGLWAGAVLFVLVGVGILRTPRSVVILGTLLATALMGATRFQSRLFALHRGGGRRSGLRIGVFGAGEAGAAIVKDMQRSSQSGLCPVAFFDDDPRKKGRSLLGVPIVGAIEEFAAVAARLEIHQAWVAAPSGGSEFVARVTNATATTSVPVRIVPALEDVVRGGISMRDVRDVRIEDLLGRQQVETDLDLVARALAGKRVLITGAGGSIGSEIARQVAAFEPAHLAILDHDETHLHDLAAVLPDAVQVLADVRDGDELRQVFLRHQPDIVFHAAAHKHVPVLETHPCQAVRTNVLGTCNVVDCAVEFGVQQLVFISTDKAVQPTSVMGASKWLGEQIVVDRAPPGSVYCAVRFGNVLGSRGSVIPTFSRQIAAGGPVTVSHPRMTRFFMSIPEAVQLVLQAAAFAEGGEIFMLDMGEPVNILELAERMIRLSGRRVGTDISIQITGPRPGEKLMEELHAPGEEIHATAHPAIQRLRPVKVPRRLLYETIDRLRTSAMLHRDAEAAAAMLFLAIDPGVPVDLPPAADVHAPVERRNGDRTSDGDVATDVHVIADVQVIDVHRSSLR